MLLTVRDGRVTEAPSGRLLYFPQRLEGRRPKDARLTAAEALEFRSRDPASAATAFRQVARSGEPTVRAAALLGLARCLRKTGREEQALAAYDELAGFGTLLVEDAPAELLARHARCALLAERKDPGLARHATALYGELLKPRWTLDRASFEYYSGEARGWLSPSSAASPSLEIAGPGGRSG